jgi:hypothetical protein
MSDILHRVGIKSSVGLKSLVATGKGAPDPNDVTIDNWN